MFVCSLLCNAPHGMPAAACLHACLCPAFMRRWTSLTKLRDCMKKKVVTAKNDLCFMMQVQVSHLPFRWQVRDENLASGLCYTSGTTGNPKVQSHTHAECSACIQLQSIKLPRRADWSLPSDMLPASPHDGQ